MRSEMFFSTDTIKIELREGNNAAGLTDCNIYLNDEVAAIADSFNPAKREYLKSVIDFAALQNRRAELRDEWRSTSETAWANHAPKFEY